MRLGRLLDYAERHAWIITLGSANLGFGIGQLLHHRVLGWFFIGAGLVFTAIRPVGTGWRRRRMIRELREIVRRGRSESE